MEESSIKVGVITDQTGPLSFLGIANAHVAKMVIDDINAKGGLLGRQIDLYLEDSATTHSVAEAKATKLVQHDQVDVIFGGILECHDVGNREHIKRLWRQVPIGGPCCGRVAAPAATLPCPLETTRR
jgi:hypothetical protein